MILGSERSESEMGNYEGHGPRNNGYSNGSGQEMDPSRNPRGEAPPSNKPGESTTEIVLSFSYTRQIKPVDMANERER